jgi:hypothetical protein
VSFLRYGHCILLPLASFGKVLGALLAVRHVRRFIVSLTLHGPEDLLTGESDRRGVTLT